MKIRFGFFFLFFLLLWSNLFSSVTTWLKSPYFYSPRQGGLGNAFTAVADDEYLLFANPAGLGTKKFIYKKPDIFFFNLINLGFFNLEGLRKIGVYFANKGGVDRLAQIRSFSFTETVNRNSHSAKVSVLSFSYLTDFWGITFLPLMEMNRASVISDFPRILAVSAITTAQMSIGFKIKSFQFFGQDQIHLALAIRPFYLLEVSTYLDDYNRYHITFDDFSFQEGVGAALDLGILWEIYYQGGHKFNVGFSLMDSPAFFYPIVSKALDLDHQNQSYFLQPNPKVGLAYFLPNYLDVFLQDTLFAVDFHRWIDTSQSWVLKFHFGISTFLFKLPYNGVSISGGINGGYLTGSIIYFLSRLRISYTFYQEELGYYSGQKPLSRHDISLSIYF